MSLEKKTPPYCPKCGEFLMDGVTEGPILGMDKDGWFVMCPRCGERWRSDSEVRGIFEEDENE